VSAVAPLASIADVLEIVIGVVLSLVGLGLVLMGVIALADRSWKGGAGATAGGALLTAVGMWLVGVL
jgi:hypothetical protein